jgi:hypothetical protein
VYFVQLLTSTAQVDIHNSNSNSRNARISTETKCLTYCSHAFGISQYRYHNNRWRKQLQLQKQQQEQQYRRRCHPVSPRKYKYHHQFTKKACNFDAEEDATDRGSHKQIKADEKFSKTTMPFSQRSPSHGKIRSIAIDRRSFFEESHIITIIPGISLSYLFWQSAPTASWSETESLAVTPSSSSSSPSMFLGLVEDGPERIKFKQKPTAPIGALLPSVQQRLLLEICIDAARQKNLRKLKTIIPPLSSGDSYGSVGKWGDLVKSKQLQILKQNDPSRVLRGEVVRAAMDLYQVNLNYAQILYGNDENSKVKISDVIEIADPVWKKSYIRRNDGLTNDFIAKVIGADVDVRQLLRNQVQTNLDDAAAELYYISSVTACTGSDDGIGGDDGEGCDLDELINLLQTAAKNFDLWLDRVRYGDVRDAIQMAVGLETGGSKTATKNIRIYDSFEAGFIPPSKK